VTNTYESIAALISDFLKVADPKRRLPMDTSVTSVEEMAREFGETLFKRGFSKVSFREFKPYQATDVLLATHAVVGLVLSGELLFQFQECLIINGVGDQFFVPANTHYQVTAGKDGAQFLFAKHCKSSLAIS
jgi:hypothetical protein